MSSWQKRVGGKRGGHNVNNGCSKAIREALASGPATLAEIIFRMGNCEFDRDTIKSQLGQMVWTQTGVISNKRKPATYTLTRGQIKDESRIVRRYAPGITKPLAGYDLHSHMELNRR